jgi:hypothetical protein
MAIARIKDRNHSFKTPVTSIILVVATYKQRILVLVIVGRDY